MSAVAAVLFCLEDETINGCMRLTCCYNHVLQLSDHVDEFLDLLDLAEWMFILALGDSTIALRFVHHL